MVAVAVGVVNALALVVAQLAVSKVPVTLASVATMRQAACQQVRARVAKVPQRVQEVHSPTGLPAKTGITVDHVQKDGMAAATSGHMAVLRLTANPARWHSATPRFALMDTKTDLNPVATVASQTPCAPALMPWQTVVATEVTATAMVVAVVGQAPRQAEATVVAPQILCAPVLVASSESSGARLSPKSSAHSPISSARSYRPGQLGCVT